MSLVEFKMHSVNLPPWENGCILSLIGEIPGNDFLPFYSPFSNGLLYSRWVKSFWIHHCCFFFSFGPKSFKNLHILISSICGTIQQFIILFYLCLLVLVYGFNRATAIFITFCLVTAILLYVTPFQVVAILLGVYILRHPRFRDPLPAVPFNFFKRLPSQSDRIL